jgi:hypothetical protein
LLIFLVKKKMKEGSKNQYEVVATKLTKLSDYLQHDLSISGFLITVKSDLKNNKTTLSLHQIRTCLL